MLVFRVFYISSGPHTSCKLKISRLPDEPLAITDLDFDGYLPSFSIILSHGG